MKTLFKTLIIACALTSTSIYASDSNMIEIFRSLSQATTTQAHSYAYEFTLKLSDTDCSFDKNSGYVQRDSKKFTLGVSESAVEFKSREKFLRFMKSIYNIDFSSFANGNYAMKVFTKEHHSEMDVLKKALPELMKSNMLKDEL